MLVIYLWRSNWLTCSNGRPASSRWVALVLLNVWVVNSLYRSALWAASFIKRWIWVLEIVLLCWEKNRCRILVSSLSAIHWFIIFKTGAGTGTRAGSFDRLDSQIVIVALSQLFHYSHFNFPEGKIRMCKLQQSVKYPVFIKASRKGELADI